MKKILLINVIIFLIIINILIGQTNIPYSASILQAQNFEYETVKNEKGERVEFTYLIFDEENNFLSERTDCEVGDRIIDKDFNVFEVYFVDNEFFLAKAKFVETLKKSKISKKQINRISSSAEEKKIGLYMTHNDESYILGDGTDSIYGAGGIHDIAIKLKEELEKHNINITIDETLHIPHNSSAYARSRPTAVKLLNENVNAVFDIHRDGIARVNYVANVNDEERCKIRIVVGLGNSNMEKNLEFATIIFQIGNELYPWLFKDIYMAKNTYNQDLASKCLLFEMGTYTIEKDLVFDSTVELADVINTTLFNTTIDENGSLTINGDETDLTINEYLNEVDTGNIIWIIIFLASILIFVIASIIYKNRNQKKA